MDQLHNLAVTFCRHRPTSVVLGQSCVIRDGNQTHVLRFGFCSVRLQYCRSDEEKSHYPHLEVLVRRDVDVDKWTSTAGGGELVVNRTINLGLFFGLTSGEWP